MLTLILLATCVPILAGIAYVAMRKCCPQVVADIRGIALQTVIIIVVLLAIAGSVAGVLLTRSGDVTTQLESQEVITGLVTSQSACTAYNMGGVLGVYAAGPPATCTWTSATANDASVTDVTQSKCLLVRGTFTAGATATTQNCVVNI